MNKNKSSEKFEPRKWLILLEISQNPGLNGNQLRNFLSEKFVSFAHPSYKSKSLYNWLNQLERDGFIISKKVEGDILGEKKGIVGTKYYFLSEKGEEAIKKLDFVCFFMGESLFKWCLEFLELKKAVKIYQIENDINSCIKSFLEKKIEEKESELWSFFTYKFIKRNLEKEEVHREWQRIVFQAGDLARKLLEDDS